MLIVAEYEGLASKIQSCITVFRGRLFLFTAAYWGQIVQSEQIKKQEKCHKNIQNDGVSHSWLIVEKVETNWQLKRFELLLSL